MTTLAGAAGITGSVDGTGSAARFANEMGMAADSVGSIYVADQANHTIRKLNLAGEVDTVARRAGYSGRADGIGSNARFRWPYGIAIDRSGNLYVADTFNHTIRKITSASEVSTVGGMAGISGSADGEGSNSRFNQPWGVAVDSLGNLYVADTANNSIRKGVSLTARAQFTSLDFTAGGLPRP